MKLVMLLLLSLVIHANAQTDPQIIKEATQRLECGYLPSNNETDQLIEIDKYLTECAVGQYSPNLLMGRCSEDQVAVAYSRLQDKIDKALTRPMEDNFELMQNQLCNLKDHIDVAGTFKELKPPEGRIDGVDFCEVPTPVMIPSKGVTPAEVAQINSDNEAKVEAGKVINTSLLGPNGSFKDYYSKYLSYRHCITSIFFKYGDKVRTDVSIPHMTVKYRELPPHGNFYQFRLYSKTQDEANRSTRCGGPNGEYIVTPNYACVMKRTGMWDGKEGFFQPHGGENLMKRVTGFQEHKSKLEALKGGAGTVLMSAPISPILEAIK